MKKQPTIGILGAGITGLSTAWALKKRGFNITVYEKQDYPGGKIKTFRKDDWLVEEGPNTMLVKDKEIWDLLDELNLNERIVKPRTEAKKRYIVRDEKLQPVPLSIMGLLKTNLLSTKAKLRLLNEPFVEASQKEDESIASFINRRLGTEPLDYAVDPFISGVYAGDPEKLSAKHAFSSLFELEQAYGSITKGFLKREKKTQSTKRALISFDAGLQVLPQAFANKLNSCIHLNTEVTQITPKQNEWDITMLKDGGEITNKHQKLISTLPLYQLSAIWNDEKSGSFVNELQSIEYSPISILALGFKKTQIRKTLDGFGMLIPSKESYSLLGCLFSSTLFSKRAPKNHVLLTCFIGGTRNRKVPGYSVQTLIGQIMPQLNHLLGIKGEPVFQHHFSWEKAIPQYSVGYQRYLENMESLESQNPGLFLAGNFRGGVSVPDCIIHGIDAAREVKE